MTTKPVTSAGRKRHKRLSPDERSEVIQEILGGAFDEELAVKYGVSFMTIRNLRKAALAEQRKAG